MTGVTFENFRGGFTEPVQHHRSIRRPDKLSTHSGEAGIYPNLIAEKQTRLANLGDIAKGEDTAGNQPLFDARGPPVFDDATILKFDFAGSRDFGLCQ